MNTPALTTLPDTRQAKIPLSEQRELLRLRLQAQRLVIAAQLIQKEVEEHSQPQSMLMRFLTQQNGVKIVAETAAVVLGTRWLKSTLGRGLGKILQSLVVNKLKA